MKNTLSIVATLGGALCVLTGIAVAQQLTARQAKVEIDGVKAIMQKTPEYGAQTSDSKKEPKRREWLEVEVAYETDSDSPIGMIDNLLFKYYIAVKGEGANYILTESVTYENIPDKEEMYSVVYVSPWSLARMTGEVGRFREADVVAVGVEILFNGERKDVYSSTNAEFWNSGGNFQRPQGMILPKEKSPFAYLWIDRHAPAKLSN